MYRLPSILILSLLCFFAFACGGGGGKGDDGPGDENEPGCNLTCAANQACTSDGTACQCATGFADCDGNPANGCEQAGSCDNPGCTYEGDAAFCARHESECGGRAGTDNCGRTRTVDCGACAEHEACGALQPNVCAPASCEPESDSRLCAAEGIECGSPRVVDNCGDSRRISCGSCPAGERCVDGSCEESPLGVREPCYLDGVPQGVCDGGLVCAGDETFAVCQRSCRSDAQCPGSERCAIDYWMDGSGNGICGDLRVEGESCHWESEGADFCWDDARPNENPTLACFDGTCRYICRVEGFGEGECPAGFTCGADWQHWSDLGLDAKTCEEGPPAGDGEVCMWGGEMVANCAGEMVCVDFGGGEGRCQLPCLSDTTCPGNQTCALGYLLDGRGVCGELRQAGEACGAQADGEPWCWDSENPDMALICRVGSCTYICDADGAPQHPAWPCPEGLTCGPLTWSTEYRNYLAECIDPRVGEKEACTADADCLPALACVSDGTASVCQPVCTENADCAGGRICRAGILADGRSACIDAQGEGESCTTSVQTGSNLCVDDAAPAGNSLECVGGSCRYVCDWESDGQPAAACPANFECSTTFRTIPGHTDRGAICEPPCVPQTDSQLCSLAGAGCGEITSTDRCGTRRTVSCGSCASGSACNGNACLSSNIPVNGACLDRSGGPVACATGLTCVTWGTGFDAYGACKQACFSDFECPGIQTCATGTLSGGGGICGTPRQQGQTCSSIRTGSNFCWDIGSPSGSLFDCLGGVCEYVCAVENAGQFNCPWGDTCGSTWETYSDVAARVRLCE